MALTPMMKQYKGFKQQYPDKIVLFRMGDFYEVFHEDAKKAAKILNITLTARDKGKNATPMAGFPHHSLNQYLPKIIDAGECAVVVEQVEDPKQAKGVVKRAVTRVVTPGTLDGELASSQKSSYLMAIAVDKEQLGASIVDMSTGEFKVFEIEFNQDNLESALAAYAPSEVVISDQETLLELGNIPIQVVDDNEVKGDKAEEVILDYYEAKSLEGLGLETFTAAVDSVAIAIQYIQETQKMKPDHFSRPQIISRDGTMQLDRSTISNLDLVANSHTGDTKSSLLGILDNTNTQMGGRLLYSWILNPLTDFSKIQKRLGMVERLREFSALNDLLKILSKTSDIERIVGKVGLNRANGKDLKDLQQGIEMIVEIAALVDTDDYLKEALEFNKYLSHEEYPLVKLAGMIEEAIIDDPPPTIMEGGVIKHGFDGEVDELKDLKSNSKEWMDEFIRNEKEKTGIGSMKMGFNKVFGYYIEVTKAHTDKVPGDYVRKQTLVNSERYITEELKKKEDIILNADEKLAELEYKLFQKLREDVLPYIEVLRSASNTLAYLDVLAGFADLSLKRVYSKPKVYKQGKKEGVLLIKDGRHPVVEEISDEEFIANSIELKQEVNRVSIITGPNMSGKSTYIRQVALLVLMAQIGTYVPATEMEFSIVDRVFSRVGASDNLAEGRSTFMVEMEEAANILNNATQDSLVILDEVGRGTSTFDGVSIAWALSEYLIKELKCRSLFATHYHELLQLAEDHPDFVKNLNVDVAEDDKGEIIFKRKIVEGGTDRSYGIYVAKLAGVPKSIVERADEILETLESDENKAGTLKVRKPQVQIAMFNPEGKSDQNNELLKRLKELKVDEMTPIEALNLLSEIKADLSED